MIRHIKTSSKVLPSVRTMSWCAPSVNKAMVADALGAEDSSEIVSAVKGSPPALLALRQALLERLRSRGGRQGLEGATRRQKIPLSEEDWEHLQKLAEVNQREGVSATAEQVAGVLLHQALEALERGEHGQPAKTTTQDRKSITPRLKAGACEEQALID